MLKKKSITIYNWKLLTCSCGDILPCLLSIDSPSTWSCKQTIKTLPRHCWFLDSTFFTLVPFWSVCLSTRKLKNLASRKRLRCSLGSSSKFGSLWSGSSLRWSLPPLYIGLKWHPFSNPIMIFQSLRKRTSGALRKEMTSSGILSGRPFSLGSSWPSRLWLGWCTSGMMNSTIPSLTERRLPQAETRLEKCSYASLLLEESRLCTGFGFYWSPRMLTIRSRAESDL